MFALPFHFVSLPSLLETIRANVSRIPRDIDLIVGIPRSGMIPAYAIGLYLNLPVIDLAGFLQRRTPSHGRTRTPSRTMADPFEAGRILLVDDSCMSGGTLDHARSALQASGYPGGIVSLAAILEPAGHAKVDLWFAEVPSPRVFEWNVFHHAFIEDACVDFDGVLCVDPSDGENDDGPNYARFIANARPLHVPTRRIGHIVSARLEKYRKPSEEWLSRHGIGYGDLHLLDLPSREERLRLGAHHRHKAEVYVRSGASLFIESDPTQAAAIAQITGRPVLCAGDMKLYSGGGVYPRNVMTHVRRNRDRFLRALSTVRQQYLDFSRKP